GKRRGPSNLLFIHTQALTDDRYDSLRDRSNCFSLIEQHVCRCPDEPKQSPTIGTRCITGRSGWLNGNRGVANRAVIWNTFGGSGRNYWSHLGHPRYSRLRRQCLTTQGATK